MKIGRSGYQNVDLSAFTGDSVTIPGIYAKVTSGLPLKISNLIGVGDFYTSGILSGTTCYIPVVDISGTSLTIIGLTVTPADVVSVAE